MYRTKKLVVTLSVATLTAGGLLGLQATSASAEQTTATAAAGCKYRVTAKRGLRIRSGPGTKYRVVGSLRKGARVNASCSTRGGWRKVSNGWAAGGYLARAR